MNTKQKGFTLIELLVVIAIISILSSVVLATLNDTRAKARDTQRIAELGSIRTALELYRNEFGRYPIGATTIGASPNTAHIAQSDGAFGGWGALATDLQDYIDLPGDPVGNTPLTWWPINVGVDGSELTYFYSSDASGSQYDLIANLETDHNVRCEIKNYRNKTFIGPGTNWCDNVPFSEAPFLRVYSVVRD